MPMAETGYCWQLPASSLCKAISTINTRSRKTRQRKESIPMRWRLAGASDRLRQTKNCCPHENDLPAVPPPKKKKKKRSSRWTSGSPRMLLVLVPEFESHRGEILNLFAKKKRKKKDQLLRAPSVGKRNSTRADEGRNS